MIAKETIEKLCVNIGKGISIDYVQYGNNETVMAILKGVDEIGISTKRTFYPFVGYGCAIRMIMREDGEMLYDNSALISLHYDARSKEDIERYIRETFGEEAAAEFKKDWLV